MPPETIEQVLNAFQWRKDCQQQLENEKEERQMELLEKQKQEEQKVLQAEESRRAKLNKGSADGVAHVKEAGRNVLTQDVL